MEERETGRQQQADSREGKVGAGARKTLNAEQRAWVVPGLGDDLGL